jgi:hypothetical protein
VRIAISESEGEGESGKGGDVPARATVAERRALRLMTDDSISSPTRKRKRTRPMLATSER